MSVHRKYDRGLIVVVVLVVIGIAAFQPRFTLRSDMPDEFADLSSVPTTKRLAEEKIAKAYWDCARRQIQWSYGYGQRLPDNAPPEFAVTTDALSKDANSASTRDRYWLRLERVWYLPTSWNKSYAWNPQAMTRSLHEAGQWIELQMRRITGL